MINSLSESSSYSMWEKGTVGVNKTSILFPINQNSAPGTACIQYLLFCTLVFSNFILSLSSQTENFRDLSKFLQAYQHTARTFPAPSPSPCINKAINRSFNQSSNFFKPPTKCLSVVIHLSEEKHVCQISLVR